MYTCVIDRIDRHFCCYKTLKGYLQADIYVEWQPFLLPMQFVSSAHPAKATDTETTIFGSGFRKFRNLHLEAQLFVEPRKVNSVLDIRV